MAIEFKLPEAIEKQLRGVQIIAENAMRPESRYLDDHEHERPVRYVSMMWPQMQEMERVNIAAAKARAKAKQEAVMAQKANGHGGVAVLDAPPEKAAEGPAKPSIATLSLVHMIEMLSWGDAGIYLCIPAGALGGAAINAVGTPEQIERFLTRFTEGEPKWGAMAMTEPQAGSDTGNIQTTATFDPNTNEWILNGQKIFCTSGKLALEESDGLVVVWATVDKKVGRAGMKPFVVEAGTPGVIIAKVEEKLGIRASDTATIIFDNARIPADNLLGDAEVKTGEGTKGFKGAMKTFDTTRPIVAASAIGIGRAAFEFTRDALAKEGVRIEYGKPRWKLTSVQADLLEMESQLARCLAADAQGHGPAGRQAGEQARVLHGQGQGRPGGDPGDPESGGVAWPAGLQHRVPGGKVDARRQDQRHLRGHRADQHPDRGPRDSGVHAE